MISPANLRGLRDEDRPPRNRSFPPGSENPCCCSLHVIDNKYENVLYNSGLQRGVGGGGGGEGANRFSSRKNNGGILVE
jgi:hypothetical protein